MISKTEIFALVSGLIGVAANILTIIAASITLQQVHPNVEVTPTIETSALSRLLIVLSIGVLLYSWFIISWFLIRRKFLLMRTKAPKNNKQISWSVEMSNRFIRHSAKTFLGVGILIFPVGFTVHQDFWIAFMLFPIGPLVMMAGLNFLMPVIYDDMDELSIDWETVFSF